MSKIEQPINGHPILDPFTWLVNVIVQPRTGEGSSPANGEHFQANLDEIRSKLVERIDVANRLDVTESNKVLDARQAGVLVELINEMTSLVWQVQVEDEKATPTEGRFIVADGATGDWAGHEGEIVEWDGEWQFTTPENGWAIYLEDRGELWAYHDGWRVMANLGKIRDYLLQTEQARDDVLLDTGFIAVAGDLTGSNTIGTVAGSIGNVNTVGGNIANVNKVGAIDSKVTTVANNNANVTKVANVDSDVTKVAGIDTAVTNVSGIKDNVVAVDGNKANINAVHANKTNIDKVANNETNINKVASVDSDVSTVAGIDGDVTNVASIKQDVTDVASIKSNVTNVANIKDNVVAVDGNKTNINAVHANKNNIDKVANINNDVTKVANIDTDVSAVALIDDDVTDVALIKQDVTDVAGIKTNVTNVAGIKDNVVAVDGNKANINAVHANKTNIDAVAGNKTNIDAVKNNSANINTVAGNLSGANTIGTVAGSISNVNNVGGNIGNVNAVASNKSNIDAVAGNKSNIDTVAGMKDNINALAPHSQAVADLGARTEELDLVAEALGDIDDLEKVNNKKSTLSENSETYYPNQKAVNLGLNRIMSEMMGYAPRNLMDVFGTLTVPATFEALRNYLIASGGCDFSILRLGDYIDLDSFTVQNWYNGAAYNSSSGAWDTPATVTKNLSYENTRVEIVGFSDYRYVGNTAYPSTPHVTFQFKNIPLTAPMHKLNASPFYSTSQGYTGSDLITIGLANWYTAIASQFGTATPYNVDRSIATVNSAEWCGAEKLFLPTAMNVFGSPGYALSAEGVRTQTQFPLYALNPNKRMKRRNGSIRQYWWLAEPSAGSSSHFTSVYRYGFLISYASYSSLGVAPAFLI